MGARGHSDVDVVYHVAVESIMGLKQAISVPFSGYRFPLQRHVFVILRPRSDAICQKAQAQILYVDVTVYLEKPKLYQYKTKMAQNIACLLGISETQVSVKATTMEKRGLVGKEEGVAAEAVCLVKRNI